MEWLAIVGPPAIWLNAVFASPYLKTHRDGVSLSLSILAGLLAFAYLKLGDLTLFICSCCALGAMLFSMLLPPRNAALKQKSVTKRKVH